MYGGESSGGSRRSSSSSSRRRSGSRSGSGSTVVRAWRRAEWAAFMGMAVRRQGSAMTGTKASDSSW